jgi:hypothetical protein
MRILLIGLLSATLIGCSCLMPPQASVEGFSRMAVADPPAELEPAPFSASPATAKPKPTAASKATKPTKPTAVAARPAKPSSARPGNESASAEEKVPAPIIMKPETPASGQTSKQKTSPKPDSPASGQPAEGPDPVLKKARTTVAAKLEDPASAEFDDMKREMRKNTFGQPVDTICGHVRSKKASGEGSGERAFLYLVKDDEAYVVDGNAESAAATAYRNICMNSGFARKGSPPTREP